MHRNGYIILIWILYNSKFRTPLKFLGTTVAFVERVHCITIIISVLIIIIIITAKNEETALAFIFDVFIIYRLVISKFPDFSLTSA